MEKFKFLVVSFSLMQQSKGEKGGQEANGPFIHQNPMLFTYRTRKLDILQMIEGISPEMLQFLRTLIIQK